MEKYSEEQIDKVMNDGVRFEKNCQTINAYFHYGEIDCWSEIFRFLDFMGIDNYSESYENKTDFLEKYPDMEDFIDGNPEVSKINCIFWID